MQIIVWITSSAYQQKTHDKVEKLVRYNLFGIKKIRDTFKFKDSTKLNLESFFFSKNSQISNFLEKLKEELADGHHIALYDIFSMCSDFKILSYFLFELGFLSLIKRFNIFIIVNTDRKGFENYIILLLKYSDLGVYFLENSLRIKNNRTKTQITKKIC